MRRKILTYLGVSALFGVVFILAIFFTLPTESIRHFAEKTIEKQLKQEQSIEIEDLRVSPLLNVTLKKFQMRPRNPEIVAENLRTAGGDYNGFWCAPYVEEQTFVIDEIFVNPSIFKIIKKKPAGKFELKIQEGTIKGEVKSSGNLMEMTAEAKQISMNEFALLSNLSKMQIYGDLEFDLRAVLEDSKLAALNLDLTAANTALCPKRLKLNTPSLPYFELPFTVFGNINATISVEKDKIKIEKLVSDGPDIKLNVKGSVALKSPKNAFPRFELEADITPSEEWVKENQMKMIYQFCEKLEDGSVHLSVTGTSQKPKIDCGTPIPEPVEDVEPAAVDNAAAGDKADDGKAKEKKVEEKKPEEKKEEAPEEKKTEGVVRPVREKADLSGELLQRDPSTLSGENRDTRLRMPNRPNMPRGNRNERPAGMRGERANRPDRGLEGGVELRGVEKLDESARKDRRRRGRSFGDSDNND